MAAATGSFATNDAVTKLLLSSMNVGQIMLVRGLVATSLVALLAWRHGALRGARAAWHPAVALRTASEIVSTVAFLSALSFVPLANLSAVMQALPLAVTTGAALFLGERVGWRRWLSIATGFLGVLIVLRPGFEGFNGFALMALISVAACAVRDLATRGAPAQVPSLLMTTVTSAAITVTGGVLVAPYGGWSPMGGDDWALLLLGAGLLMLAYQLLILATRVGDISFSAPFRYVALLIAIVLGAVLFGEIPDAATLFGSAVVVASGLYMLYRERVRGQRMAAESAAVPTVGGGPR